jgi:hypothetical protein
LTTTSTAISAKIILQPTPIPVNVSSIKPLVRTGNFSAINVASRTRLEPSTSNTSATNPTLTTTVHHQSFVGISTTTQPSLAHTSSNQPVLHNAEVQSEPLVSISINPSDVLSDNSLPVIDDVNTILSQQMYEDPQQPPPLINPQQEVVGSSSQMPTTPQLSFQVIFNFLMHPKLNPLILLYHK